MTRILYFDNSNIPAKSSKRRDFNIQRLRQIMQGSVVEIVAPYSCKRTLHDGGLDEQFEIIGENPRHYDAIIINRDSRGWDGYESLADLVQEEAPEVGKLLLVTWDATKPSEVSIRKDAHIARCNFEDVSAALKQYLRD